MDLQQFIRNTIKGKLVVLVGNARFQRDCSEFIDAHDCVFRFNLFSENGFFEGLSGSRFTHWCNNLGRNPRPHRERRRQHCEMIKKLTPRPVVLTHSHEDRHGRLKFAQRWYPEQGIELLYPDSHLQMPIDLQGEPSAGFYMACRLLHENIPISVIGFNGGVNPKHHDGKAEMDYLANHEKVNLQMDF